MPRQQSLLLHRIPILSRCLKDRLQHGFQQQQRCLSARVTGSNNLPAPHHHDPLPTFSTLGPSSSNPHNLIPGQSGPKNVVSLRNSSTTLTNKLPLSKLSHTSHRCSSYHSSGVILASSSSFKVQALLNVPYTGRRFSCCSSGSSSHVLGRWPSEPAEARQLHTSTPRLKVVEFLLADIGEGIQEVIIKEWFVSVGDKVSQFDNICEVQSDKASVTITSRYDGTIARLHHDVDDTALVGKPLVDIEVPKDVDSLAVGAELPEQEAIPVGEEGGREAGPVHLPVAKVITTPAVRRLSKENNVDLTAVQGTGRDGRILKEDVLNYIAKGARTRASPSPSLQAPPPAPSPVAAPPRTPAAAPAPVAAAGVAPQPLPTVAGQDRTEPIRGIQKAMTKTMTAAMRVPHFLYCDDVDLTALVGLKARLQEEAALYGVRFSFMPLFIKAASIALTQHPGLNASVDDNCENITYKAAHNIGVAMATPAGLLVPNIKSVQERSLLEVAGELNRLQQLGSKGALGAEDLKGGTFTLSNIGSIGGTYAKPIILPPEVAIGALGKIQVLPRYNSAGEVAPAHIMQVSWSADHRVIDGATMARFSNAWRTMLQEPALLALYMK